MWPSEADSPAGSCWDAAAATAASNDAGAGVASAGARASRKTSAQRPVAANRATPQAKGRSGMSPVISSAMPARHKVAQALQTATSPTTYRGWTTARGPKTQRVQRLARSASSIAAIGIPRPATPAADREKDLVMVICHSAPRVLDGVVSRPTAPRRSPGAPPRRAAAAKEHA